MKFLDADFLLKSCITFIEKKIKKPGYSVLIYITFIHTTTVILNRLYIGV